MKNNLNSWQNIKKCLKTYEVIFDLKKKKSELDELRTATEEPHFWEDQKKAQAHMEEIKKRELWVKPFEELTKQAEDIEFTNGQLFS